MHEWALAESVVETVLKVKDEEKFNRVIRIKVKLGSLQQIDNDIFRAALEDIAASKGEVFEGMEIQLEEDQAVLKCRVCGNIWEFGKLSELTEENYEDIHFVPEVAHIYVRCPSCRSPDFEVVRGRGVVIDYIEGE